MGHIRALLTVSALQWKVIFGKRDYIPVMILSIPMVALLAWIARVGDRPEVLAYISVGAGLVTLWNGLIQRMGWLVNSEVFEGTLDLNLLSRTPLILVMLGKAVGLAAVSTLSAVAAFLTVVAVARHSIDVASLPLLLVSLFIALQALVACGFIFAPMYVLMGGRPGFFNAITPLGVLLSGFLHPTSLLPASLELLARLLPTSWAMHAVIGAVRGSSTWELAQHWLVALALTAAYVGLAYFLFRAVEHRVRVTGVLGRH